MMFSLAGIIDNCLAEIVSMTEFDKGIEPLMNSAARCLCLLLQICRHSPDCL